MYYEINVTYKNRHFFATAPRSIKDDKTLEIILELFKTKFPKKEGYDLILNKYPEKGQTTYKTDLYNLSAKQVIKLLKNLEI